MADGSTKPISQVKVGDLVKAVDEVTGETKVSPVSDVIIGHGTKDLITLSVDADGDGRSQKITATANHPFFVQGRGWVDAVQLTPGSRLSNPDGSTPKVTATGRTQAVRTVFNLTVAGTHTYYVVADGQPSLVHNCSRNSSKWFSNRRKAYQQRRKDYQSLTRRGYSCELRGPCSNGGHAHLTWRKNGRWGTIHYRWHGRGRGRMG
ncbi:HINT domain-containing protein [Streptomyces lateritius]|nr:HINT domain-containing protein [Streptomyces lateritius]